LAWPISAASSATPNGEGLSFFSPFDRLGDDAVLRPLLGRQVKQHHRHLDVDQVRGNLRAHHACAEHGDFANLEIYSLFSNWRMI
jgi:hypothetical protein